ncbi:hypothetical protein Dda_8102 [Drechslerella dactyloides]|uniref:Uncharacterized protein n=1 Tax=Drechslerella dactyloides TaxID=74499 RepID=A0AAD6NGA2_DREDA|nr:hypothetical protein Dda_8102 [Drechslerella dactyloides]
MQTISKTDNNNAEGEEGFNNGLSLPDEFFLPASLVFGALEVLLALNISPPSSTPSISNSADPNRDFLQMASMMADSMSKMAAEPPRPAVPAPGTAPPAAAPPPTPSKIPLPPTPFSPLSLKGQGVGTPNEVPLDPRLGPRVSTNASSLPGAGTNGFPGASNTIPGYGFPSQTGLPSLVFPPTTHQAYHTRNLLLHIYSMFNGAQAAIHQLGANCEFNQNLITFLSNQLVEKDRKIQTLTASVNMLQTAVQRAMKNNEELKKAEEGLQEEIKALQSNSSSEADKEDADLVAKVDKLTQELEASTAEKQTMARDHDKKLGELGKEVEELKETVEILEESLRYAVALRFQDDDDLEMDDIPEHDADLHELRNDEDRAEKMLNGRLEDVSAASDDSLIDEVNGAAHRENGHVLFTDGASSSSGSGYLSNRPIYLDSIMEEPEEEDKEDGESPHRGRGEAPRPVAAEAVCPAPVTAATPRTATKLRATAKPFVRSGDASSDYQYFNNENMHLQQGGSTVFL